MVVHGVNKDNLPKNFLVWLLCYLCRAGLGQSCHVGHSVVLSNIHLKPNYNEY